MVIADRLAQDPDWLAMVHLKHAYTPTKEWAKKAETMLKQRLATDERCKKLYDAISDELILLESRARDIDKAENQRIALDFRKRMHIA